MFVLTENDDWLIHCYNDYFFVWELALLGILQADATQIMHPAVVDLFKYAANEGHFLTLTLAFTTVLYTLRDT